jgi:Toprim domain/CHC2 zinc finger
MILADAIERARQADLLSEAMRLGARLKRLGGPEFAGSCPTCGGRDRFSVNTRKQVWHCRGCGRGGRDAIGLVMHVRGCDFREAVEWLAGEDTAPAPARVAPPAPPKPKPDTSAFVVQLVADIVREIVPVRRSPGERYLAEVRQIDVDAVADVLERIDAIGWHPSVYFNEPEYPERGDPPDPLHGRRLGCIVTIMTDPVTAARTGAISRTYLGPNGCKVDKAKTLGAPAGIVRLSRDEDVEGGLHLVEGLETGLSAMALGFRPLWATGSTSPMRVFPVLGGIEAVTFLADRDGNGAGEDAATEAARRWRAAGREARIKRLSGSLGDINDAVRRESR